MNSDGSGAMEQYKNSAWYIKISKSFLDYLFAYTVVAAVSNKHHV